MSFSRTPSESSAPIHARVWQSTPGFLLAISLLYVAIILAATLTLNAYFSQTWDVVTFIHAGQNLLDGSPWDLYAQSRAAQNWPYAYPPLHAFVTALALMIGNVIGVLPDYAWARVPAILADIGVAIILFAMVRRKSDEATARVAALIWLFNPLTFYDTAVQGHFESEWLVFVLLAYYWFENSRNFILPSIALAFAVLFKQIAILFALPIFVSWFVRWVSKPTNYPTIKLSNLITSSFSFAAFIIAICLPFLLYSDDFAFMNLTYVENVPVQTQSWIVALLGMTRAAPNALTSDFFLLRYQTIVTLLVAGVIAFIAARREWNLYLTATLIALAFFLTSKKVMGYYYVMLFPFLVAEILPKRRFDLATIVIVATTWIALSPYYAAWVNHAQWWVYAILGSLNSLFFVWLFLVIASRPERNKVESKEAAKQSPTSDVEILRFAQNDTFAFIRASQRPMILLSLGLCAASAGAALVQPIIASASSPIRAPILAPGMEMQAMIAFGSVIALSAITLVIGARAMRAESRTTIFAFGITLIFAPLFFAIYALTKESTAIFEIALKALGV
ncbi:MAG: hypothetical protein HZC40_08460 [Chloroflexi bacterium]|nr:hypothetical protein [Chloroflexota bacterium]